MSRRTSSRSTLTIVPSTMSPSLKYLMVSSMAARKSSTEPMSLTATCGVVGASVLLGMWADAPECGQMVVPCAVNPPPRRRPEAESDHRNRYRHDECGPSPYRGTTAHNAESRVPRGTRPGPTRSCPVPQALNRATDLPHRACDKRVDVDATEWR